MKTAKTTLILLLLTFLQGKAQITLNSWAGGQPQMTTYNEMVNGKTEINQSTVNIQKYSGPNNVNEWKLTVRLIQDYTHDSYTIGAQYSSLQFNQQQNNNSSNSSLINVSSQAFQLSTFNEITLIHSNVPLTGTVNRVFRFNLVIQGGNHLLVNPNGTYYSAYEYKLYKIKNNGTEELIATRTESTNSSARLQLNYQGNNGQQNVSLQNGANIFNLQYNTAESYTNGVSQQVIKGLKVTSPTNYQLNVKASANEMTSATTSSTIPVSILNVELSTNENIPGLTIYSPISLSASDQVIAIRSQYVQSIEFNLRFFIPPNALDLSATPGTYTTYVYFVIVPN
ncbi:hypothetical protein Q763_00600 [Flavobacterium beibuense F44-8]|uniref:WxL domain-containing protein n=1 Tax=Flavobacterium beibuense F44-8 TaxID=1406840 RepID=A0A0A2LWC1_9FLAO|nr:hypothetical protein [Flavobacterium beibuense]KGO84279.1 hypothetical protein Q763_00600 [Flavobacterium beibuense F44-8]